MALTADFDSIINPELTVLSIVDNSTENYDGESIVSRSIEVTTADGESTVHSFPIISGIGDVFQIPVDGDQAMIVEMTLVSADPQGESDYVRVKNLLLANHLQQALQERLKDSLNSCTDVCDARAYDETRIIEKAYKAAWYWVGTNILGAQKFLDKGNKVAQAKSCPICHR